jgi:hypothetical protein
VATIAGLEVEEVLTIALQVLSRAPIIRRHRLIKGVNFLVPKVFLLQIT